MKKTAILLLAVPIVAFAQGKRPYDLYEPIVLRAPFGPPPDDPAVDPSSISAKDAKAAEVGAEEVTKQQQELMKSVTVCAINRDPDGSVMVGFIDNSVSKSPRNYYLRVGESRDGWDVVEADLNAKTVLLSKDSIDIECTLGKASESSSAAQGKQPAAGGGVSRSPLFGNGRPAPGGMKSRRQLREEQENAEREFRRNAVEAAARDREEAARAREEAKAALEAEREATRQQLSSIQEELRRQREERARQDAEDANGGGEEDEDD